MSKPPRNVFSPSGNTLGRLTLVMTTLPKLIMAVPVAVHASLNDIKTTDDPPLTPEQFWVNLITSVFLVLGGGVFAGLTLGLMGQDEVYLKVIATSGDDDEKKHARKVLQLIGRGKHWVLVTLLLSNVITNETLPIVLDSILGGGWPAVLASTVSIVIFGEIIPQSICVRYGLEVGSLFAPFVLVLMYVMYPVAYPIAMLLDYLLGEDHGTIYKKSGLKTLVTLHRTMGVERLNQDEVTIISAVLDLKEKSVSSIMTPIENVYTMSSDTILDEKTVEEIFNAGFSRIPIHLPNEPTNFIGMLLVRVLISYDPEDSLPVASFPLATLPETSEETSCLNILNYFQEGKSHMVVVSETPGEPIGALGVLTLEDVIEELIGEEIVDESDVYIDIHKAIKRKQPGPLSKRHLTSYLHSLYSTSQRNSLDTGNMSRRASKEGVDEAHLSALATLAPSNLASNPRSTNKTFVTIKKPVDGLSRSFEQNRAVLPPPNRDLDQSPGYGAIHVSEEGALDEAKLRNGSSSNGNYALNQKFLLPEDRNSTDLSDVKAIPSSSKSLTIPSVEYQEAHSYRTGGIIESVVNVKGVHKTIVENVSEDERDADEGTLNFSSDEEGGLLTTSKSKRKNRRMSAWDNAVSRLLGHDTNN